MKIAIIVGVALVPFFITINNGPKFVIKRPSSNRESNTQFVERLPAIAEEADLHTLSYCKRKQSGINWAPI